MKPLTAVVIRQTLARMPGWHHRKHALERSWHFSSFGEAMRFMQACVDDIERLEHHPTWTNTYDHVSVRLTTHDAGDKVTAADIALAKILDWQASTSALVEESD